MTSLFITGTTTASFLAENNLVSSELSNSSAQMAFVAELFQTRTSGAGRDMADLFGFESSNPETYALKLADFASKDELFWNTLEDILEVSGEPEDLVFFRELVQRHIMLEKESFVAGINF